MSVSVANSISAISGDNVTLANSGSDKLMVLLAFASTNDYSNPTCSFSVGGVTATAYQTVRNDVAQRRAHLAIAYIKHADYPADGSRAFTSTWSGGTVLYTRTVIIECAGADQTTPLEHIASAIGASAGSPYDLAANINSAAGKLMVALGLFVGNSYTDSSGYINSVDGHTFLKSTMPATGPWPNDRMSVYYASSVASSPQTVTMQYSLRGVTNGAHVIERAIAAAFAVNAVPAPAVVSVDGDDSISQGQQNIEIIVNNIPSGNVPVRAGAGGTNGVGGTDFTGFSVVEGGTAGSFTITADVPIGIATSSSVQCYVEYEPE